MTTKSTAIRFRDPVSGLSHLAGAALGATGLCYLLAKSVGQAPSIHVTAFSVFGVSLILLYSSSALYHLLNVSERNRAIFRRIDHTMIFVLIAGSYTPFCLVALPGNGGRWVLATVWGLALAGLFFGAVWLRAPRWLSTGLYLGMGWIVLLVIHPLAHSLSSAGLAWLVAGGLFYSIGAIVYAIKWPDPFPLVFGFHEIWHLFVLAGSISHFASVATLLP